MLKWFFRIVLVIVAIIILIPVGIWGVWMVKKDEWSASGVWRYKITVNVETPEGLKSGFAIREVHASNNNAPWRLPEVGPGKSVYGEAVAVDLGARGVLFAIMDADGSYRHVFDAFPYPRPLSLDGIRHYNRLKTGAASLAPEQYPTMVRFRDLNDPKSVELVYSAEAYDASGRKLGITDNTGKLFGPGIHLKSVVIEMTDEAVTRNINEWLKWLAVINGGYIDGQFSGGGPELSNVLHGGNFKRGETK